MQINQIHYVIFQATSQFSFKFCNISVSWHIIVWNLVTETLYALDKKNSSMYNFSGFGCSDESSNPIPHAIFETTRSGFIQILHQCSVSWKITAHILWRKIAHQSEIFGFLSGWVKIHRTLYAICETTSQFFFKLCITLRCHEW